MPEAPDLEVVKGFLTQRAVGLRVKACTVTRATVVRDLAGVLTADLPGRTLDGVHRQGKFLSLRFSGQHSLVINPMLTGVLQFCPENERRLKSTCVSLSFENGMDLRYLDDRQMGKVYHVGPDQDDDIPQYNDLGPDVLSDISLEEFRERLKRFHGEIKGVLTRGSLVSGIGNAYSDEILFAAGLSPFRKARTLKADEVAELHYQCRQVLEEAIEVLRERMAEEIHHKIRDFLKVHRKGGQPCPTCGSNITEITANQRITSYCRRCQPGMLIRN